MLDDSIHDADIHNVMYQIMTCTMHTQVLVYMYMYTCIVLDVHVYLSAPAVAVVVKMRWLLLALEGEKRYNCTSDTKYIHVHNCIMHLCFDRTYASSQMCIMSFDRILHAFYMHFFR